MKKPKRPSKRLKRLSVTGVVTRRLKRAKAPEQRAAEALASVPQITNETVAEHREEILAGARKYIYPLQHSKHRVVRTSIGLLAVVIVAFFVYVGLSLYKFQTTNSFIYGVTQVVPFPIAKAGHAYVSYESYLFELRRNMHYYQTQQQADFATKDGKAQLQRLKEQAYDQVVQDAYVKQLATQHDVTVSDQAVDNEVNLVRSQNRLGSSDRVFREVLNQFWGWDEADFKRELQQQLLQQAVVAKLDTVTNQQAQAALQQLQGGASFATVAAQDSQDASTKGNGGEYPYVITQTTTNLSPQVTEALFQLKPNQISGIINTEYSLEIVKVLDATAGSLHAAHIEFDFQPISVYLKPLELKQPPHAYVKV
jgi:parvulin-like peptidyl-prolyl isomerase